MSRFGLRKRLKAALGGPGDRGADPVHRITLVLPDGGEHAVGAEDRYTLVMASQTLDTPIATGCPDGHCGECVVDVLAGAEALAPASVAEREAYEKGQRRAATDRERLACHARVVGSGAKVKVRRVWTMETHR